VVHISSSGIPTAASQPFPFHPVEISRQANHNREK
jgi:hypothetical protein